MLITDLTGHAERQMMSIEVLSFSTVPILSPLCSRPYAHRSRPRTPGCFHGLQLGHSPLFFSWPACSPGPDATAEVPARSLLPTRNPFPTRRPFPTRLPTSSPPRPATASGAPLPFGGPVPTAASSRSIWTETRRFLECPTRPISTRTASRTGGASSGLRTPLLASGATAG